MVVRGPPQDLHGGLGFSQGSVRWLGILHRICMVIWDSPQDLHGGN